MEARAAAEARRAVRAVHGRVRPQRADDALREFILAERGPAARPRREQRGQRVEREQRVDERARELRGCAQAARAREADDLRLDRRATARSVPCARA